MRLITPQMYRCIGSKAAGLLSVKTALTVPQFYVSNPSATAYDNTGQLCVYKDQHILNNFMSEIKYFSVRSSSPLEDRPNTAMAGRFESHINVPRDRVVDTIAQVRESMRALHTKLGHPDIDCPVMVQEMVWGMPGIVFTRGSVHNKYPDGVIGANPFLKDMTYEFYPTITKGTTVDEMGVGGKVEPLFASYMEGQSSCPGLLYDYLEFLKYLFYKDLEVVFTYDTKQQASRYTNRLVLLQCRSITA